MNRRGGHLWTEMEDIYEQARVFVLNVIFKVFILNVSTKIKK